jgi:hypothetical protein
MTVYHLTVTDKGISPPFVKRVRLTAEAEAMRALAAAQANGFEAELPPVESLR